ncbi:MAG: AN1-type zinc finger domain-containing protein [Promethearchaeota archaeon]
MVECELCGKDTYMPFRCNYCEGYYCSEHRLPENHNCKGPYQFSRSTTGRARAPTQTSYRTRTVQTPRSLYWFSQTELRDLAIGLAIIIAIPLVTYLGRVELNILVGALIAYSFAFILHELAHKFMAQRLGYWAEFRVNQQGLLFTLLSFFSPFKIIAPGAVMIRGFMNLNDFGKISIAGPATNISLGLISLIVYQISGSQFLATMAIIGMSVNSSLALFNLIPLGNFDGLKIMRWNKIAWGATVLIAGLIYLISLTLPL